jgi:hypothetical protein
MQAPEGTPMGTPKINARRGSIGLAGAVLVCGSVLAILASAFPARADGPQHLVAVTQFNSNVPELPGQYVRDMLAGALMKAGVFAVSPQNGGGTEYIFDGVVTEVQPGAPGYGQPGQRPPSAPYPSAPNQFGAPPNFPGGPGYPQPGFVPNQPVPPGMYPLAYPGNQPPPGYYQPPVGGYRGVEEPVVEGSEQKDSGAEGPKDK